MNFLPEFESLKERAAAAFDVVSAGSFGRIDKATDMVADVVKQRFPAEPEVIIPEVVEPVLPEVLTTVEQQTGAGLVDIVQHVDGIGEAQANVAAAYEVQQSDPHQVVSLYTSIPQQVNEDMHDQKAA